MKKIILMAFFLMNLNLLSAQCKVYSGSSGYTVAARVENGKVYSGSSGYTVIARFENGKVYSGSSGYTVVGRGEGCGGLSFAAAVVACCL